MEKIETFLDRIETLFFPFYCSISNVLHNSFILVLYYNYTMYSIHGYLKIKI